MAFKGNGIKDGFAAFNNSLGNTEERRNGNLLGRSADSLYSGGNVFAGIGEENESDSSLTEALNLLADEKEEEVESKQEPVEIKTEKSPAPTDIVDAPVSKIDEMKESEDAVKPEKKESPSQKKEKTAALPKTTVRKKPSKATEEKEAKSIDNFYCGVKMFDDITENSYLERKKKVNYLNDLIHREVEMYEKDKEHYIETRRKKIESLKKIDKGDRKAIQVHLYESNSQFLEEVQFDVRANKSQLFCAIIAIDTERLEKKKK